MSDEWSEEKLQYVITRGIAHSLKTEGYLEGKAEGREELQKARGLVLLLITLQVATLAWFAWIYWTALC